MLAVHVGQQTALVFCPKGTVWALKLWFLPTFKLEMSCESPFPQVHLPTLGALKFISTHCCMISAVSLLRSMSLCTNGMQIGTTSGIADVCKHLLKNIWYPSILSSVTIFEIQQSLTAYQLCHIWK